MNAAFGGSLRAWRQMRGQSQLSLSLRSGVSSRHLSFLETGKSSPSREMVLALALALEVPLRDRNALLDAAGFAPLYRETPLEAPAMGPIRDAIELMLGAAKPNPAFVVNRRYDVLDANPAGRWLLQTFAEDLNQFARPYNFGRLLVSSKGLRPHVENWEEVARKVLGRLEREVGGAHARGTDRRSAARRDRPGAGRTRATKESNGSLADAGSGAPAPRIQVAADVHDYCHAGNAARRHAAGIAD